MVVNPRTVCGARAALWSDALVRLRAQRPVECVETAGDGGDRGRIAALIAATRPAVVVATGGDGTVRQVAAALHEAGPGAPALGMLPFGTANNVARSLGVPAVHQRGGAAAIERGVATILGGAERDLDLGCVGSDIFVGSCALGMDAAILAARNRWRRRWRLGPGLGGYALYLLSCAVNLTRHRAESARVQADGAPWIGPVYNLLIANTPLYAGEFRFDGGDHSADGRLDLHVFTSPLDYVRAFVTAWRRHLRDQRGEAVDPSPRLRRVERISVAVDAPLPSQLDGEEHGSAAQYEVRVLPNAIRVVAPASVPGRRAERG